MFRRSFAVAAVVGSGIFLTVGWADAQQAAPRSRSQMSLSERLQQFRRSLTGEPTPSNQTRQATQNPSTTRQRTAQRTPRGRTTTTQPRGRTTQDRTSQPGNSQKPEFLPGFGLGGLLNELTGTADFNDQYSTQPRAGSRVQPRNTATGSRPGNATTGSRPRNMTTGNPSSRRPRVTTQSNRLPSGSRSRTPNLADAPTSTRPEQASPSAIVPPRNSGRTAGNYRTLQDRLSAARRELSDRPLEPTRLRTPSAEPRIASAVERDTNVISAELTPTEHEPAVASEPLDTSATNMDDDALLFTRQSPSLQVVTAGPRKVIVGKPAKYRVLVQNSGDLAARSVIVTVKVPEWTQVVGTVPSSGTASPPVVGVAEEVQWKLDRVDPRGRESLELEIIPRKSRPFDLAVGWTQSPLMAQTTVEVQEPKLRLVISGADEATYGRNEVYKLTLSNPGNGDAENVIIRLLPVGQSNEPPVTHTIGTIRAGGRKVIEVELTPRQSGTLVIKAEAGAEGGLFASVAQEVLVRRAGIQVAVAGPPVQFAGTTASFEVQVANSGNASAENVKLTAALPGQAKYISSTGGGQYDAASGDVNWNIDRLLPGSVDVFVVKCDLTTPGTNSLQVAASADGGLEHSVASTTRVEALADLKLEVVDPRGPVQVGQETSYEVKVRNRGTKSAEEVEVLAFFSTGVEPVSVEGGRHVITHGQVEFAPIAVIPAGGEVTFRVKARADASGNHTFRAEVHCKSLGTSLVSEQTTRFYSVGQGLDGTQSITPQPAGHLHPIPAEG